MKVLVTGATGFIGGHLLSRLQLEGHEIVTAVRNSASVSKLSLTVPHTIIGEIDACTDWSESLQEVEAVIHLAARAHILQETVADPEAEFIRVNLEGTKNLVESAIAAGVKQFIFISSIGAIASQSDRTLTEKSESQPDTAYGRSKLQAEQALVSLAENTAMTWTILRPTLVYGEGNPGNMASLVKLIQRRLPLPFGGIKNQRSFLYVGNLVDAIAVCLINSQAQNQLFLLSDTETVSTPELINKIAASLKLPVTLIPIPVGLLKLLGVSADIATKILKKPLPISSNTINKLLASLPVDTSHIRNTLNWQPPYNLEQGLSKGLS